MSGRAVTAIVPVKRLSAAKSRLALPAEQRQALALAFALDTVAALSSSPLVEGVLVVTSDPVVTRQMRGLRVRLVRDDATDLDAAVRAGIRVAERWRRGAGVVVVPADLPCLRPADVTAVLQRPHPAPGAFVPDRSGTGTTMIVHRPAAVGATRYGPGSAARHAALGLRALVDAPVRARHDVDTLDDLDRARTLGLGAGTAAVVATLDRVSVPREASTEMGHASSPAAQPVTPTMRHTST